MVKRPAILLIILLSACASSGVVNLSSDRFLISKNTAKFGGGVSASAASEVSEEADEFCAKRGKKAETIDLKLTPGRIGSMGNVSLQFKCV